MELPTVDTAHAAALGHKELVDAIAEYQATLPKLQGPRAGEHLGVEFEAHTLTAQNRHHTEAGLAWLSTPPAWRVVNQPYYALHGALGQWLEASRKASRKATPSRAEARRWARKRDELAPQVVENHNRAVEAVNAKNKGRKPPQLIPAPRRGNRWD